MKKVDQLHGLETRIAIHDTQLAESRAQLAQAEQTSAHTAQLCDELRHQNATLRRQLADAKQASTLEARLAKLDAAVFGTGTAKANI